VRTILKRVRQPGGGRAPAGASAGPRMSTKGADHWAGRHSGLSRSPLIVSGPVDSRRASYTGGARDQWVSKDLHMERRARRFERCGAPGGWRW
jgi:hypothetical protein